VNPTITVHHTNAMTVCLRAANDAADATELQRLQASLEDAMLRHGRGKVIGICVEAIRSAEFRGAKW